MITVVLVLLASYALGCVVGAYYLIWLRTGADIRTMGSGNAGARNVLRSGRTLDAAITLVWDCVKGALALWLVRAMNLPQWMRAAAFVCVVAGHIWPAQLGFRGGKGAATALGAMLALDVRATFVALTVGAVAGVVRRNITTFGLVAIAASAPAVAWFDRDWLTVTLVAVATALVLVAHVPAFARTAAPAEPGPRTSTPT